MNMKKILFATMMFATTIGNANAFEFQTNNDTFVTTVINQIVTQQVEQTFGSQSTSQIGDGKHVIIRTQDVIKTGKVSRCWTSTIYNSQGTPMPQVVCY